MQADMLMNIVPTNTMATSFQRKTCVVVVDDDDDDRLFITQAFQNVGSQHKMMIFEDGEQFLHCLINGDHLNEESCRLGLIILDVNMHKIDGIELLRMIKSNPGLKHIPTVMLSTSIEEDVVQAAYHSGANSYLKKPSLMNDYNHLAISMQTCYLNVPCVKCSDVA